MDLQHQGENCFGENEDLRNENFNLKKQNSQL